MIKIIRTIIATIIVGLALGVVLVAFVGFVIHIIQIAEKNQQKEKELYNKYEYVIGKKINTGSDTTIVIKIFFTADHKVYGETYDNKTIPIEAIEKNVIK